MGWKRGGQGRRGPSLTDLYINTSLKCIVYSSKRKEGKIIRIKKKARNPWKSFQAAGRRRRPRRESEGLPGDSMSLHWDAYFRALFHRSPFKIGVSNVSAVPIRSPAEISPDRRIGAIDRSKEVFRLVIGAICGLE